MGLCIFTLTYIVALHAHNHHSWYGSSRGNTTLDCNVVSLCLCLHPEWSSAPHYCGVCVCYCYVHSRLRVLNRRFPDSKVHGTNMRPTCVLSAPDGLHVGPMNLAIRVSFTLPAAHTSFRTSIPMGNRDQEFLYTLPVIPNCTLLSHRLHHVSYN